MKAGISDNAIKLATDLSNHSIYLAPKKGSIFEELVDELCEMVPAKAVYTVEEYQRTVNDHLESVRPSIFASFEQNDPDAEQVIEGSPFELVCEQVQEELTAVIDGVMGAMKTEVLPSIVSIANDTMAAINDQLSGIDLRVNIVGDKSDMAIWANPSFIKLLAWGDKEISGAATSNKAMFSDLSIEFLADRIKTGEDLLDAEINEYLNEFDRITLIEHTFHEVFARNEEGVYQGQTKLGEAIVAFLLAMSFHNELPDGVRGVELGEFRAEMMAIAKHYSALLLETMSNYLFNTQRERLVLHLPSSAALYEHGAEVVVNARLVNRFYEMGGTVDGILGNVLDGCHGDLHTLLDSNFKNEHKWRDFIRMETLRHEDNFQRHFLLALRQRLYRHAEETGTTISDADMEKLFDSMHYITKETAFEFISTQVNELFYKNKEYAYLIKCLNVTTAKFPEMNPDEALSFAMIDWLAEWAISQVNVS